MRKLWLAIALAVSWGSGAIAGQDIRLTLEQGTPVTEADIAGANSVCLEPYGSPRGQLWTFDGTNWTQINVPRATHCLSTAGLTANTNYDIVVSASGGAPVLAWSPPYADDTHPPARAWQDGMEVLASDHTKLIIGGCRINALIECEDNHTHRWLSNYYQRVWRKMLVQDIAKVWTVCNPTDGTPYCNATAYRQANGNPADQLDFFCVTDCQVEARAAAVVISINGGGAAFVGIGLNGALGDISDGKEQASMSPSTLTVSYPTSVHFFGYVGQGHNTMPWLEHLYTPGPYIWLGSVPPSQVSGISGKVLN
jgi:hypothetical protein